MTIDPREHRERLWIPVVAPIVWSTHFTICYALTALWCGRFAAIGGSATPVVGGITALSIAVMAVCFGYGWKRHDRRLPAEPNDDDSPGDRRQFVAFTTMLLAALSMLGTLFVAGAAMLMGGCG